MVDSMETLVTAALSVAALVVLNRALVATATAASEGSSTTIPCVIPTECHASGSTPYRPDNGE